MAQITPRVIPDGYEFLTCLTQNTEWTPPEAGFYRITCIGKSGDGATGGTGRYEKGTGGDHYGDWICTYYGGAGGIGGGTGGIARSVLDLRASEKIHCTVSTSVSSFGSHLSATAAVWNTPGEGKGGNDFNTTGESGGSGGRGGYHKALNGYPAGSNTTYPANGENGGGNGARGGQAYRPEHYAGEGGGGGGGGATYKLPPNIAYDDPLVTTYIVQSLANHYGGNGGSGRNGSPTAASSYPVFNPLAPVWYGGGSGGGGASAGSNSVNSSRSGAAGSAGSPGGILIEKGVFH